MKVGILSRLLFGKRIYLILALSLLVVFLGAALTTIFLGTFNRYQMLTKSSSDDEELLVLTKEVGLFNTLLNAPVKFGKEDLEAINDSEHFLEVSQLTPSMFSVEARLDINIGMRTSLFLEALDSKYLEPGISGFKWEPGEKIVPLVISNEFVDLYNFGFSMALGFPQINPQNIGNIPMELQVSGKSGRESFKARIVGTTRRIQSILAPKEFVDWANLNLAGLKRVDPSRVIVKVNKNDEGLNEYLAANNWVANQESINVDKIKILGKWILASLAFFCLIFGLVVFFLLLSNIRISIFTRIEEWRRLVEIGYPPNVFSKLILRTLLIVSIISFGLTSMLSIVFHNWLADRLWSTRLFWPSGIQSPDFFFNLIFHGLILLISFMILRVDQKKIP